MVERLIDLISIAAARLGIISFLTIQSLEHRLLGHESLIASDQESTNAHQSSEKTANIGEKVQKGLLSPRCHNLLVCMFHFELEVLYVFREYSMWHS